MLSCWHLQAYVTPHNMWFGSLDRSDTHFLGRIWVVMNDYQMNHSTIGLPKKKLSMNSWLKCLYQSCVLCYLSSSCSSLPSILWAAQYLSSTFCLIEVGLSELLFPAVKINLKWLGAFSVFGVTACLSSSLLSDACGPGYFPLQSVSPTSVF